MEPILKAYFNTFKRNCEISTVSTNENEQKLKETSAFEKFVNYTILSLDNIDVFTGDLDLLDIVSVGGGNDTALDGIGIRVNDELVRSIEEVSHIVANCRKKIEVEFIFIQSKMQTNFEAAEFNNFGLGVKNFFSEPNLPENDKIKAMRAIKDFIYTDENVLMKLNSPNLNLYYVATGVKPDNQHFDGVKKILKKDLENMDFYFENIKIEFIDRKILIDYCKELENNVEVQMNIQDIFPLIVDTNTDVVKKAYAFTCKANEFLKLLQKDDENKTLRKTLFNDNVRDYLGGKGTVNNEIEKTIKESPEMFLLCNNGVTIVCSNFDQVRDKLVKIENPQIVNGCQTSNSIYNQRNHANIDKVQLLIRLISTEDYEISNKVVRGTNKQNQVLDEAFEATRPFHKDVLEPFFLSIEQNNPKLLYERRLKQYNDNPKKTEIVSLRILTHSFVGMFLNCPHKAFVQHEAKLLEEFANDKNGRKIFREEHEPRLYYLSALTWYMFEKYLREGKIEAKYKSYRAHLYLVFRESISKPLPKFAKSRGLDKYCQDLEEALKEGNFEANLQKVLQVFDLTLTTWKERGKKSSGIKDVPEFTQLLLTKSKDFFNDNKNNTQQQNTNKEEQEDYDGEIFTIRKRGSHWFGFIKLGENTENIFFDNRGYQGNIDELENGVKVKFEMGKANNKIFAKNIEIVA